MKCSYNKCKNAYWACKKANKDIHFFTFPKDEHLCHLWIQMCDRPDLLNKDIRTLRNYRVCSEHFESEMFMNSKERRRLLPRAVPKKYGSYFSKILSNDESHDNTVFEPQIQLSTAKCPNEEYFIQIGDQSKVYSGNPLHSNSNAEGTEGACDRPINLVSPAEQILRRKVKVLSNRVAKLKKNIKAKYCKNRRLKEKKSSKLSFNEELDNLLVKKSIFLKTFVKMQLFRTKDSKWTKAEQELAISLYYKSPEVYKFMVYNLKFVLPSPKAIQNWLKFDYVEPGLDRGLINKLSSKAKTMSSEEKIVSVMFDEITLKPNLEYIQYKDKIEGFEDLGDIGKSPKIANTAIVFLIRGILHNWKMPLAYYLSSGPVSSINLQKIIINVIKQLRQMTFNPTVLISDQRSNYRDVMNLLGASKENPVVYIEGQKLFTCFDTRHLLMNLRNDFLNPKLRIMVNDNFVSWADIIKTYVIDKTSNTTRIMTKITDTHICPTNIQKMQIKYAAQIFSNTVAVGIRTASRIGENTNPSAIHTASFVETVNNIFDALNCRTFDDPNPNRKPLSTDNESTLNILTMALEYFKNIEIFENDEKSNNTYCIHGFEWTINSIILLWHHLQELGVKYLLTGFINRDAVENFFSVIKNRAEHDQTPTVKECRIALQHIMYTRLVSVENESYQLQESQYETTNEHIATPTTKGRTNTETVEVCNIKKEVLEDEMEQNLVEMEVPSPNAEIEEEIKIKTELLEYETEQNFVDMGTSSNIVSTDTEIKEECNVKAEILGDETEQTLVKIEIPSCTTTLEDALETCSAAYVAGYLALKIITKFKCEKCDSHLLTSDCLLDPNELLILSENYNCDQDEIQYLRGPTEEFLGIIIDALQTFNIAYENYKYEINITENLYRFLRAYFSNNYPQWWQQQIDNQCEDHLNFMLYSFINMQIYKNVRSESENHRNGKEETRKRKNEEALSNPHKKIRILKT